MKVPGNGPLPSTTITHQNGTTKFRTSTKGARKRSGRYRDQYEYCTRTVQAAQGLEAVDDTLLSLSRYERNRLCLISLPRTPAYWTWTMDRRAYRITAVPSGPQITIHLLYYHATCSRLHPLSSL